MTVSAANRSGRARSLGGLAAAALAVTALFTACGDDTPPPSDVDGPTLGPVAPTDLRPDESWRALVAQPTRDLGLLQLMVRLDAVHVGMGPFIRHRPSFEQLALAADAIAAMCEEPIFAQHTEASGFGRNPERFEALRTQLLESARAAAKAARADDIDELWFQYSSMDATCVGCHKRYGPLH